MPTLQQIEHIHDQYGSAKTLALYLQALHAIGVLQYDSFIKDGHSEYFCEGGEQLVSLAIYEELVVADSANKEQLLQVLDLHKEGKTDYFTMMKGLAGSGIERWQFDTAEQTITYFDKAGNGLLRESIE
ncbi:MAG TPA: DUF1398 family protein [Candidatus Saccharimonadia bacterium]|nr:DUF1398 family protein [Candidatus Saccharimonadia bacterium]